MKLYLIASFFIFFPGCSNNSQEKDVYKDEPTQAEIYDLNESTNIILTLIKNEKLPLILAESENDVDKIDTLLKNFSPSEIAFEAEVLNQEKPVIILFYDPIDNNEEIIWVLTELAKKYNDQFKFVKIDKEKLFKITEKSEIDVFPTISVIHDRQEITRFEKPVISELDNELQKYAV